MLPPQPIHQPSLAKQFDRRVKRIGDVDFLLREVERRLFARLDYIKINPQRLLDVGCGLGQSAVTLASRFPAAQVIAVDLSAAMTAAAQARLKPPAASNWRGGLAAILSKKKAPPNSAIDFLNADVHQLPLATSSVDFIWSNMALHWFADPAAVFGEWQRVLRPNGLVLFSYLGPTTLQELAALGLKLPTFQDLHDIGDGLTKQRLVQPVMDMESLMVTYSDPKKMLSELSALGGNPLSNRFAGLRGRRYLQQMQALLAGQMPVKLTFEVVYGHAWVPSRKILPEGMAPIEFRPLPNKLGH
jgi:malonyl-CoA O-methyltransferase